MEALHSWDAPLAVVVAAVVVKELLALVRWLVARRNGTDAHMATKADLAHTETQLLAEMRRGQDALHGRITDISTGLARLEGRLEGRTP